VEDFLERHEEDPPVQLVSGFASVLAIREDLAPAALLVRPLGAVLIDSLHPFAFGNVRRQSLEECWRGVLDNWCAPEITRWARGVRNGKGGLATAEVVPYRDEEVPVGAAATNGAAHRNGEPKPAPERKHPGTADLDAAREHVMQVALARRYRLAPHRWSGDTDGDRYVRAIESGRVCRLNRTAAIVMEALDGGTAGDAVDRLASRYPAIARERLEHDVIGSVRWLRSRGVVVPAAAPADRAEPALAESVSELP
jgi:hypothetical protein